MLISNLDSSKLDISKYHESAIDNAWYSAVVSYMQNTASNLASGATRIGNNSEASYNTYGCLVVWAKVNPSWWCAIALPVYPVSNPFFISYCNGAIQRAMYL